MPILFADDTNLFCTSQNVNSIIEEINRELANVYAWVQSNKLSLNIDKTNYMLFSPKCACKPSKIIVIYGQSIMEVNETKFLGVIIDNRLKWSSHLGHISNKISNGIGIITKVRKVFDASTLMSLYNSLILPYIMYCVHVWGSAYETHLRQLMSLQNKIVKLIAGVPRRTNADALYVKLNILPLKSSMFIMWDCLCINMIMTCYLNCLLTCLLRCVIFIIMIHGNLQDIICMYIFTERYGGMAGDGRLQGTSCTCVGFAYCDFCDDLGKRVQPLLKLICCGRGK